LERNQKANDLLQKDYTYHVHSEEQDTDSNGATKKTIITDAESLTIDGVRINRVVARNNHPLTPEEARKENDRIDKDVAKGKEKRAKNESKGKDTDNRGDELISASRILELGHFSNPRRVDLNGRPTIALDFAGDPGAATHNAAERLIRGLVGTVWVDEQNRIMVRAEGHFPDDFKIAGGLVADIHKGFSFEVAFTTIGGQVWLPQTVHAQGSARVLLFKRISGSFQLTTSDYRKYRTSTTIIPTDRIIGPDGQPITPPDVTEPAAPKSDHQP
ncbi:MAG: hypothetical protein V4555_06575, partial [Acidobacteriota bacterium]